MSRTWSTDSAGDSGDARFAIEQLAGWIVYADAKAALLLAAVAVLAGELGSQGDTILRRLPPPSPAGWVAVLALAVSAVAIVAAIAFVVRAAMPTLEASTGFSRYSWVSLASASVADLMKVEPDQDREEGWRTAVLLASIARRKFRNLRHAFRWSMVGGLAFLLAMLAGVGR